MLQQLKLSARFTAGGASPPAEITARDATHGPEMHRAGTRVYEQ